MIKVFYVDEEADTEGMLSKFEVLREEGIEVYAVVDAARVLGELATRADGTHLLVLDIIMPPNGVGTEAETNGGVETGLLLLKQIRRRYPTLPVMIVSVRPRSELDEAIAGYDVVAVINKPVDGTTLARRIIEVVRPLGAGKQHK